MVQICLIIFSALLQQAEVISFAEHDHGMTYGARGWLANSDGAAT